MMMSRPWVGRGAVLALLACVAGCRGDGAPRPRIDRVRTAEAAAPPPPAASPATLAERLGAELAARPRGALTLDGLVAQIGHRGLVLARTRQVLAAPIGARYCAAALTAEGLGLSVCEFDSADAALAARAFSKTQFDALVPDRRLYVNGQSLLTLAQVRPELEAESQTIAATFAAMHAQ